MRRLVIIGNSAAGLAAIEAIRAHDRASRVTLIAAEHHPPYSRVMLTYLLAGKVRRGELYLHRPDWYERMNVEALVGRRAVGIDSRGGYVLIEGGTPDSHGRATRRSSNSKRIAYDRLLIATGAAAQRPALPGIDLPGVFCLRDLDDALALLRYADERQLLGQAHSGRMSAPRAVFLGGGPVCLQALTVLAARGMRVALVVRSSAILSQLADAYTAALAEKVLRAKCVTVVKNAEPVGIEHAGPARAARLTVQLRDGRRIASDLVIIGKGTQPNAELTRGTDIATDVGILVDETMATSAEGVFAAGDVAQATHCVTGRHVCYGTWTNACEQGRMAGLNMIGRHTAWLGGLNRNVTTIFGNTLGSVGVFPPADRARLRAQSGETRTYCFVDPRRRVSRRLVFTGGRCDGAVLWNACDDLGVLSWLISTRRDCSGWEDRLTRGAQTASDAIRKGIATSAAGRSSAQQVWSVRQNHCGTG